MDLTLSEWLFAILVWGGTAFIIGYFVRGWWKESTREEKWSAFWKGIVIVFIIGGIRVAVRLNDKSSNLIIDLQSHFASLLTSNCFQSLSACSVYL